MSEEKKPPTTREIWEQLQGKTGDSALAVLANFGQAWYECGYLDGRLRGK